MIVCGPPASARVTSPFAQRPDRVPVLLDHIGEVGDLEQDRRRHRHRGRAEHDDAAEQELLVHPPRLRAHGTGG